MCQVNFQCKVCDMQTSSMVPRTYARDYLIYYTMFQVNFQYEVSGKLQQQKPFLFRLKIPSFFLQRCSAFLTVRPSLSSDCLGNPTTKNESACSGAASGKFRPDMVLAAGARDTCF